VLAYTVTV